MSGSLNSGGQDQKPRQQNKIKRMITTVDERLMLPVEQQLSSQDRKPSVRTLTYTVYTFIIFLLLTSLAVRFPTDKVKVVFISISSILIGVVVFFVAKDFWRDFCRYCGLGKHTGHRKYT